MKRNGLFWGIAAITLGVIFMGQNYGWFYIDWSFFSRFWPVLIILAGLNLIFSRQRSSAAVVTTVLLAITVPLAVVGVFHRNDWDGNHFEYHYDGENEGDNDDNGADERIDEENEERSDDDSNEGQNVKIQTNHIAEPMNPGIEQAALKFESGAGRFYIGSASDSLIEADTRMSVSSYSMSVSHNDQTRTADLELKLDDDQIKLKSGELVNRVDMRLNAKPAWTFDFGIGAGQADFDLSSYNVKSLKMGAGAADIELKLGDKAPQSDVKIEAGVASVRVKVPTGVGCQVETEGALNSRKLEGFTDLGGGIYQTPGYATSPKKILIRYEGGMSSLNVVRY